VPGFILHHEKGRIVIQTGHIEFYGCPGPPPSLDIDEEFGIFEEPMKRYLDEYIKRF
jgi:hypothetical protein